MNFFSSVTCTGTCPRISNVTVNLSSSVEEDGRQFACPGELVTLTCEVNQSAIVRIAAEPFICRNDPVFYIASDNVGSSNFHRTFQAILTMVRPKPRPGHAITNFRVTLTANTTNETSNTVIECADQLDSQRVQSKALIQSGKTK